MTTYAKVMNFRNDIDKNLISFQSRPQNLLENPIWLYLGIFIIKYAEIV